MVNSNIKNAMQAITQGVYIIGTKMGEGVNGMTAAWLTQISSGPNTILVAVGKTHYTAELIKESKNFSVSILNEDQESIARTCGYVSGRKAQKLQNIEYSLSANGNPLIKGAVAHLDCTVASIIDLGDHFLFVGEVKESNLFGGTPLQYQENVFF